jgi:hypothetical protein
MVDDTISIPQSHMATHRGPRETSRGQAGLGPPAAHPFITSLGPLPNNLTNKSPMAVTPRILKPEPPSDRLPGDASRSGPAGAPGDNPYLAAASAPPLVVPGRPFATRAPEPKRHAAPLLIVHRSLRGRTLKILARAAGSKTRLRSGPRILASLACPPSHTCPAGYICFSRRGPSHAARRFSRRAALLSFLFAQKGTLAQSRSPTLVECWQAITCPREAEASFPRPVEKGVSP